MGKARNISTQFTINWYGYGSSPSGNRSSLWVWTGSTWAGEQAHMNGSVTKLSLNDTTPSNNIMDDGFIYALVNAQASDGVTASLVRTDYVELQLTIKTPVKQAFINQIKVSYPRYNVSGLYANNFDGHVNNRLVFYGIPSGKTSIESNSEVNLAGYQLQNRWFKNVTNPN